MWYAVNEYVALNKNIYQNRVHNQKKKTCVWNNKLINNQFQPTISHRWKVDQRKASFIKTNICSVWIEVERGGYHTVFTLMILASTKICCRLLNILSVFTHWQYKAHTKWYTQNSSQIINCICSHDWWHADTKYAKIYQMNESTRITIEMTASNLAFRHTHTIITIDTASLLQTVTKWKNKLWITLKKWLILIYGDSFIQGKKMQ